MSWAPRSCNARSTYWANRYPVRPGGLYLDTVTISEHKIRIDYTEYVTDCQPVTAWNNWGESYLTTVPKRSAEWYDLNSTADCQKLERMLEDAERTRAFQPTRAKPS